MSLSKFAQLIIAKIKGDEAEVIALKNEKQAKAAVNSQISALQSKIVDLEQAVEDAKEALEAAWLPVTVIKDKNLYINTIKNCDNVLQKAKEDLEDAQYSLEYFEQNKKERFEQS